MSKQHLRWGYCGAREMGLQVLKTLTSAGFMPDWVATLADCDPQEKNQFAALAQSATVEERWLADHSEQLAALDFILVARYNLLPEAIFTAPKWGSYNLHPSLLPKYRGVHPVSWALINGETETGVTLHQIDAGIDTGYIVKQTSLSITPHHDIHTLNADLNNLCSQLAVDFLKQATATGQPPTTFPQQGTATYARRRTPQDSQLCWPCSAANLLNHVRALQPPYPLCELHIDGMQALQIVACEVTGNQSQQPGAVCFVNENEYLLDCLDQRVLVKIP